MQTNKRYHFTFFLILITYAISSMNYVYANQGSITASVTIICPFNINISSLPTYIRDGYVRINYTLRASRDCQTQNINGTYSLVYVHNSTKIYNVNINSGTVNATGEIYGISINTNSLPAGKYLETVNFSGAGQSVSAQKDISFLSLPQINITGFAYQSTLPQYSPVTFRVNATNFGDLASNVFTLYLTINSPSGNYSAYNYSEMALRPGQRENKEISLLGLAQEPGTYNATAYAIYNVNGTNKTSNIVHALFTVSAAGGSQLSGSQPKIHNTNLIPHVALVSVPSYISLTSGSQSLSQIQIKNTGTYPETINISVPREFGSVVNMSAKSLYLQQGQSVSDEIVFSPNESMTHGTYVVPIRFSTNIEYGSSSNTTEYLVFTVYNRTSSAPSIMNQLSFINNNTQAQGSVKIVMPANNTIGNAVMDTYLPRDSVPNISDISAYGIQNNITQNGGFYIIKWNIGSLAKGSTLIGYYSMVNPNIDFLDQNIQNTLSEAGTSQASATLRIESISVPTLYTNSSGSIGVYVLYTGTTLLPVNFYLSGAQGLSLNQDYISVNATPNELLHESFNTHTNATSGTFILNLYVSAGNTNVSSVLPIVVLPSQSPILISNTIIVQQQNPAQAQLGLSVYPWIAGIFVVFVITIFLYLSRAYLSRNRYSKDRAKRLVMMREKIKREIGEGDG